MRSGTALLRHRLWAVFLALAIFLLSTGTVSASPRPPAMIADTSTPASTLVSYYNAIDRGEYVRAYSYLTVQTRPLLSRFESAYGGAPFIRLGAMRLIGYMDVSSVHASVCMSVNFTSIDRQTRRYTRFHGWFIEDSTTGEEPNFGGWRINLAASRIFQIRRGIHSLQDLRCHVM